METSILICSGCDKGKPRTEFTEYQRRYRPNSGKVGYCRACARLRNQNGYSKRKYAYFQTEERKRAMKEASWQRKYGITRAEYEEMFESQGGVCAICSKPETGIFRGTLRSLSVDHCHDTGEVRGLLCSSCNTGLGHFRDNQDLLSKAIKYLNTKSPD